MRIVSGIKPTNSAPGQCVLCPDGTRTPQKALNIFVDGYRDHYGFKSFCRTIQIPAPLTTCRLQKTINPNCEALTPSRMSCLALKFSVPCYEKILVEIFNLMYKAEPIYRQSYRNREALKITILKWVNWYNYQNLLGSIRFMEQLRPRQTFIDDKLVRPWWSDLTSKNTA